MGNVCQINIFWGGKIFDIRAVFGLESVLIFEDVIDAERNKI